MVLRVQGKVYNYLVEGTTTISRENTKVKNYSLPLSKKNHFSIKLKLKMAPLQVLIEASRGVAASKL